METTIIYGLYDPITGKCRYVGQTSNPEKRLRQHLSDCKTAKSLENRKKSEWVYSLLLKDLKPELKVLEEVRKSNWKSKERSWIKRMKDNGEPLLNLAPGGGYIPRKKRKRRIF